MVHTNGTLPYHCYRATNVTDARIGCVPTVPTPLYHCVGQFANAGCINIYILKGECRRAKAVYPAGQVPGLINYGLPSLFTCIQIEYGIHTAT
jgi:hypothetical protein